MIDPKEFPKSPNVHDLANRPADGPEHKFTATAHAKELWAVGFPDPGEQAPIEVERMTATVRYWYHGRDWALEDLERAAPYILRSVLDNLAVGLRGIVEAVEARQFRRGPGWLPPGGPDARFTYPPDHVELANGKAVGDNDVD